MITAWWSSIGLQGKKELTNSMVTPFIHIQSFLLRETLNAIQHLTHHPQCSEPLVLHILPYYDSHITTNTKVRNSGVVQNQKIYCDFLWSMINYKEIVLSKCFLLKSHIKYHLGHGCSRKQNEDPPPPRSWMQKPGIKWIICFFFVCD